MGNRIIAGTILSLALIFAPGLAKAVPTKGDKKKPSTKTQAQSKAGSKAQKESKAKKDSKAQNSAKVKKDTKKKRSDSSSRSYRSQRASAPVQSDILMSSESPAPKKAGAGVSDTPPLMKVTPQRDGRFLLEPLSPKKPGTPISRTTGAPAPVEQVSASERQYNRFEPWDFKELILTQASYYKGTPYRYGGSLTTGSATDCSGFVQFIYRGFKIDLPRSSGEQAQVGKTVAHTMDYSKLLPGDLLFFSRGGRYIGHSGIYLGEGKMIHASTYRTGVIVTDLRRSSYETNFVVAKRVFEVKYQQ
jgi:cell wall-associated NlpC family hydrolase